MGVGGGYKILIMPLQLAFLYFRLRLEHKNQAQNTKLQHLSMPVYSMEARKIVFNCRT